MRDVVTSSNAQTRPVQVIQIFLHPDLNSCRDPYRPSDCLRSLFLYLPSRINGSMHYFELVTSMKCLRYCSQYTVLITIDVQELIRLEIRQNAQISTLSYFWFTCNFRTRLLELSYWCSASSSTTCSLRGTTDLRHSDTWVHRFQMTFAGARWPVQRCWRISEENVEFFREAGTSALTAEQTPTLQWPVASPAMGHWGTYTPLDFQQFRF